jgi:hypothetical protein
LAHIVNVYDTKKTFGNKKIVRVAAVPMATVSTSATLMAIIGFTSPSATSYRHVALAIPI